MRHLSNLFSILFVSMTSLFSLWPATALHADSHMTSTALLPGWNNMGAINNGGVYGIATLGNDVYAVGTFTDASGNTSADRVARWDGAQWQALGTGLNNAAYVIAIHNGEIYVGGDFTDAGGNVNADRIARWDGATWNPIGTGLSATVLSLRFSGNDLYAGGNFLNAGGNANADRIARWDGAQWNALGNGLSAFVYSIDLATEGIIAGGIFQNAGGNPAADNIAWWNGTAWQPLGSGLNSGVFKVVVSGGLVYAGGLFSDAGGNTSADRIAYWDGSLWHPLGSGLSAEVYSIVVENSTVFAGGAFLNAGGNLQADRIAYWDGTCWQAFENGLNNFVNALALDGANLYVGGTFTLAGGINGNNRIVRWDRSQDCHDCDPCTMDVYQSGQCQFIPMNCDDGDPCTVDNCDGGSCTHTPVPDSDNDGACDAIDGCPADPNKTTPGICGCGNPEPGSPCNDGNPFTVDDIIDANCNCIGTPVACIDNNGCNDGDPCTQDLCESGFCIAVPIPDSDNDGTCDAIDGCPNDPDKIVPGICGCGNDEPGSPCNDGDACTINDVIDANCNCTGTFQDTDNDGTCDAEDGCPSDPAKIVPGVCGCGNDEPGSPCDDVDACTINDVIDVNCNCTGTFQDTDNDGTCDAEDGCPNDPDKIAPGVCGCGNDEPGTACDDGIALTVNDKIDENCNCTGTLVLCNDNGDCDDNDPCTVDVCADGICQHTELQDTDNDGTCDAEDGCPNDPDKIVPGICGCGNDEPGTACDDGDACTINDVIDATCNCTGTFQDTDNDGTCDAEDGCPSDPNKTVPGICGCGNDEPGTACDDGDACTINDLIDANCNCTGSFQDTDNDGTCDAEDGCPNDPDKIAPGICGCGNDEPGTACDDGDACTINDLIDANCNCTGTFQDTDNDGTCDAEDGCPNDPDKIVPGICGCGNDEPGTACDDGDACTINDVIDATCNCTGTFQDSDNDGTCNAEDGCPNDPDKTDTGFCGCGNDEPGTACDDGDACTINDVIDATCNCTGTFQDSDNDGTCNAEDGCPNDPDKIAPGICGCGNDEPGSPCNDGNPNTLNDMIDENCDCTGEPVGEGPPEAVCGTMVVYVDRNAPVYDGPGSQNIWWIPIEDLDGGSTYSSGDPDIEVKRYQSSIPFNWTTDGACVDSIPNTTYNNPDKGIVYRTCLPVRNADFNIWRYYKLRITDEYGSDECTGLVKVIPVNGTFFAPILPSQNIAVTDHILDPHVPNAEASLLPEESNTVRQSETALQIFPNPGTDILQIQWTGITDEIVYVRIMDANARNIVSQRFTSLSGPNLHTYDLHDHSAGVYIIMVYSDTWISTTKWTKVQE